MSATSPNANSTKSYNRFNRIISSSVFQKVTMALTGLLLIGFVIMHLSGNITLYFPDGTPFNKYADFLASFGWLFYAAEIGLLTLFLVHIVTAIQISRLNKAARPVGYKAYQTKGGPSRANLSSRFMIVSGILLLAFLILHIWQFRFGPGVADGYLVEMDGKQIRDLHRLVVETFQNPVFVVIYVFAMIMLAFHLRHGFWSAFQSLGARSPNLHNILQKLAILLAVAISLGFMGIPIWIYFR
ncbi:MAG: succinate dehydrogenase cytochrome b subunit [Bdellovibrionota bacterium]